jgi:WD40 repeat protein
LINFNIQMGNTVSILKIDDAIVCRYPPRPEFIAELLAHPVYSLASKINAEYIRALVYRRELESRKLNWNALLMSIHPSQRLAVLCRGQLSARLVQKLIRFRSQRALKLVLKPALRVLAQHNFVGLKKSNATCVSTLQGHSQDVSSVAFHPSAPYLATGSGDNTAKLWLLNADCSAATCVSTLQGHSQSVTSVAFHPSAPYLATGSWDKTAKLWLLNADCSAATCVSTLQGHINGVTSVAFHASAPYLATGSVDKTAKLWLLNADCSAATCVSTLQGHSNGVTSVAFHASAPYLATGSDDGTTKLWR